MASAPAAKPLARAQSFAQRIGLSLPILAAPTAGACPPSLAIAVANAGGMGACGALLMQPAAIAAAFVRKTRSARLLACLRSFRRLPMQCASRSSPPGWHRRCARRRGGAPPRRQRSHDRQRLSALAGSETGPGMGGATGQHRSPSDDSDSCFHRTHRTRRRKSLRGRLVRARCAPARALPRPARTHASDARSGNPRRRSRTHANVGGPGIETRNRRTRRRLRPPVVGGSAAPSRLTVLTRKPASTAEPDGPARQETRRARGSTPSPGNRSARRPRPSSLPASGHPQAGRASRSKFPPG